MAILAFVLLSACVSPPEPIQTFERFSSREDESGVSQFAYIISWVNSQLDPSFTGGERPTERRDGAQSPDRSRRRASDERFTPQADKETKLDLEDKAALGLTKKLKEKGLCAEGHIIEQVIWENGRIRLMGNCL